MRGADKLFVPVLQKPLLLYCLETFERAVQVDSIAIAAAEGSLDRVSRLVLENRITKVDSVVSGGARRQDSVVNGLNALNGFEIVLVHDGARPFVDQATIDRAVGVATESGAGTAAVPVKDTIKIVGTDMTIESTPPRDALWAAQTPQSFHTELLRRAHRLITDEVTDDAAMVEAVGHPVRIFMGSQQNIKVTTPEDIVLAEAIAMSRLDPDVR